jgi:hypothetical protein
MKVSFEHEAIDRPLVNPAPMSVLVPAEGLRLRLALAAGEELAEATLGLRRHAGAEVPAFPPPAVETSSGAGVSGVSWVKADWGSARTVRSFSLGFGASVAAPLLVRVQIATGGSGWFSPPGPHAFPLQNVTGTTQLAGTFPDTVADRVMLEFLDQASGQPTNVTLDNPPLQLGFGAHARDLGLRMAGGRDFFGHAGELAAGAERPVPDLLAVLRAASSAARPGPDDIDKPVDLVIEIRAAVSGFVALTWGFAASRIVRRFADQADTRRLVLPWSEPVREAVPLAPPGRPERLTVALTGEPVPERLVLQPAPSELGEAVAALCRPLVENAQPFALALAQPLAGVDLWARPLTTKVTARVDVRADEGGRPAAVPNRALAGTLVIDEQSVARGPSWWPVTFDAPGAPPVTGPGARFWLCLQIDEGELLWFLGAQRPAAAESPRYRRDQGDWLVRERATGVAGAPEAAAWALARLRVVETAPPPPPDAQIVLVSHDGTELPYPLVAGPDGLRWDAAGLQPPVPATIARVDLRLVASVASTVTLTNLQLGYRPSNGG